MRESSGQKFLKPHYSRQTHTGLITLFDFLSLCPLFPRLIFSSPPYTLPLSESSPLVKAQLKFCLPMRFHCPLELHQPQFLSSELHGPFSYLHDDPYHIPPCIMVFGCISVSYSACKHMDRGDYILCISIPPIKSCM